MNAGISSKARDMIQTLDIMLDDFYFVFEIQAFVGTDVRYQASSVWAGCD